MEDWKVHRFAAIVFTCSFVFSLILLCKNNFNFDFIIYMLPIIPLLVLYAGLTHLGKTNKPLASSTTPLVISPSVKKTIDTCEVMDRTEADYGLIDEYLQRTHTQTHKYRLDIVNVFSLQRTGEEEKFKRDIGNRMLLWHGTRTENVVGIITKGLRIAPPEAKLSGVNFGKGIYFADMVTKSAIYCDKNLHSYESRRSNSGIFCSLLLCEVALGKQQKEINPTLRNNLRPGFNSLHGVGQYIPNNSTFIHRPEGYLIPSGKYVKNDESNLVLCYNEYIVYDPDQVVMRFLVEAKATFI